MVGPSIARCFGVSAPDCFPIVTAVRATKEEGDVEF